MRRLLTGSAILVLATFASAIGQPPKLPDKPKPSDLIKEADKRQQIEKQREKVQADTAIAGALANDPDVQMAKARIQLAEAELAKARQVVTLKVLTLKAKIDQLKVDVATAEERVAHTTRLHEKSMVPQSQLLAERDKLLVAKSALALAETEWKMLTGTAVGTASDPTVADPAHAQATASALKWLLANPAGNDDLMTHRYLALMQAARQEREAVKGPIPDQIRAALDKPVKLGAKGETVRIGQALEVFKKEAGLDVPVRGELLFDRPRTDEKGQPLVAPDGKLIMLRSPIVSEGETLPVGAWLQLFQDEIGGTFYVREYGLLFTDRKSAPPDALTLTEFWKQKPPVPKTEGKPKDEPRPK